MFGNKKLADEIYRLNSQIQVLEGTIQRLQTEMWALRRAIEPEPIMRAVASGVSSGYLLTDRHMPTMVCGNTYPPIRGEVSG